MLASALAVALALAIEPTASRVDVSGGVAIEVRGGRAPVLITEEPQLSLMTIVTPDVDMEAAWRRGGTLNLGYSPVVQYRAPNRLGLNRPILLHQAYVAYDEALSRRWSLGVNLGGSIGETDYTGVPALVDDDAQAPNAAIFSFVVGSGSVRVDGRLSRRHALSVEPTVAYRQLLAAEGETAGDAALTATAEQFTGSAPTRLIAQLSGIDSLTLSIAPGYADFGGGDTTFASADARARWDRRLRPSLSSALALGVFAAEAVVGGSGQRRVFPVGAGSIAGDLRRRANHTVRGQLDVAVEGFFGRVEADVDPRATVTGSLTVSLPPRWTLRAIAGALTNVTAEPRDEDAQVPETLFRLTTPVTYELSGTQRFEFGTIVTVRAPHLNAADFTSQQVETWLYVAYRIGAGTARGGDEVGGAVGGPIGRSQRGLGSEEGGRRR